MRHVRATLFSIAAVALVTGAVYALQPVAPVVSLGALYVFAVLPVAVFWGLGYAIAVAIASELVFNFLFLPPVHTLALHDSQNWVALAVYLVIAVVVSELAARSRRRAQEASLLAEVATSLLERGTVSSELDRISAETAQALQAERAEIVLGDPASDGYALTAGGRRVGTIRLEGLPRGSAAARGRLLPALASLLGVAIDRERLAAEALEAEALRRADVMKTALLRAVSHDLRTPLMAISTSASALARRDLSLDDADRAELLATVTAASAQLDHLVGNLLDLSRLQAGAAQPDQGLVELEELVIAALGELGDEGARAEVTFGERSPSVVVDPHQIQRVLVNLIENALKYSPADEPIRVQVSATQSEALVRVIDHGPGIPEGERERIFEPFQRGSRGADARGVDTRGAEAPGAEAPRPEAPGAGLGLAIARGFAEANGGRLTVESRSGQGATFVLALPAARAKVPA